VRGALLGLALLAGVAVTAPAPRAASGARLTPVILDTDIGPDVDDAGTVALLHALADRGEAQILAMANCTSSEWGAPCLDALNTYYRRPNIPVGTFKGQGFLANPQEHEKYNRAVAERFPNSLKSGRSAPDAAVVYREVLSAQPDRSVTFCAVGPLNNLQRLLDSRPDAFSALSGAELVARKVKQLYVMGGRYPEGKEWNFEQDPAAAARVMRDWPTPVCLSGFEIGVRVHTGARLASEAPAESPLRAAYALYIGAGKERESWDQTAALAAVRGPFVHWSASAPGTVSVDPKTGANRWRPAAGGRHRYLIERDSIPRVKQTIEELMLQAPASPPHRGLFARTTSIARALRPGPHRHSALGLARR